MTSPAAGGILRPLARPPWSASLRSSTTSDIRRLSRKNPITASGRPAVSPSCSPAISRRPTPRPPQRSARRAGRLLSRTVHHIHRVLRRHPRRGWRHSSDPADLVRPPKVKLQADEDPGRRWDGRADRGGEGRPALFVPIILGVLCGLRRGEVVALRWRSVDLERGQMAVSASTEQTDDGIREKEAKSGKSRAVALRHDHRGASRQHRLRQAEQLLAPGDAARR